MYDFSSQIMSYLLHMLIYVGIILLDNLLQCLLFIAMIDLCRTSDSTATLIYNALVYRSIPELGISSD
jgi:predicted small integral membrane protein